MTKRVFVAGLGAAVIAAAVLAGCGGGGSTSTTESSSSTAAAAGTSQGATGGTLLVGAALGLTGFLAPYDQTALQGFRLGVDEINAAGGIDGKTKIEIRVMDTRSDAAQTAVASQELLDGGIDVLVPPSDGDPSIAGGQRAQKAQVPAFSFAASQPAMTTSVGDFMFGNYTTDNGNAWALANYAIAQGYRKAYLLGSPDQIYTETYPQFFATTFKEKGGTIVGEGTFSSSQQDFGAEVTKIKNTNPAPDVIMTSAFEPVFPAFIKQLRAAGVETPVVGNDALDTPTILGLGATVEGLVYPVPGFPEPGGALEAFYKKITAKYGEENAVVYAAVGYDLAQVLKAAVHAAGTTDPVALRDAIANLKDVQGVTSTITYAGAANRFPERTIYLVGVHNGQRELIQKLVADPSQIPQP